ncbi:MAG: hypothetical protein JOZ49_22465 [Mycolicibacterium sp.]|nr:hypothetical protein [Mycolicibacterium sp.]
MNDSMALQESSVLLNVGLGPMPLDRGLAPRALLDIIAANRAAASMSLIPSSRWP